MKARIKAWKDKVNEWIQMTGYFFVDCYGWFRSLWIYCFRSITKPGIFYGYSNYYWATKYAEKRFSKWHSEWDQDGRPHNSPNGFIGGGSPYYTPKHTKFKGYMREALRTDRGHGYNKHRIHALR